MDVPCDIFVLGLKGDAPILCVGQDPRDPRRPNKECLARRTIQVYSFDGELSHITNQRYTIYKEFPFLKPKSKSKHIQTSTRPRWEFIHAAVTGPHTKGNNTVGYFEQRGDEGSMLIMGPDSENKAVEVPLTTIDDFCDQRKIHIVDVIKVDAERSDIEVIEGAFHTIKYRGVQMITAECFDCAGYHWHNLFQKLDRQFGFDCYVGGENDLLYRLTNCHHPSFVDLVPPTPECFNDKLSLACTRWGGSGYSRLDGNVFCAHRERAHALASILDGYRCVEMMM